MLCLHAPCAVVGHHQHCIYASRPTTCLQRRTVVYRHRPLTAPNWLPQVSRNHQGCSAHSTPCASSRPHTAPPTTPRLATLAALTALGLLPAALLVPAMALAEEVAVPLQEGQDFEQGLVAVFFTLAIVALIIVTLGVAYLSLTSWIDSRTEQQDRDAIQLPIDQEKPRKVGKPVESKRGGGKGFGGGKSEF